MLFTRVHSILNDEMVKDRTFEFRSTIETISNGLFPRSSYPAIGSFGSDQFLDKASKITRDLNKTSAKLDQLNKSTEHCFFLVFTLILLFSRQEQVDF